jgi:hypothetical protein
MRLLQVCNVGDILGGTAACAWTVTRALPQVEHRVVFLSRIVGETPRVFAPVVVEQWECVDEARLARWRPDVVLLHNTPPGRVGRIDSAVTVQYVHSAGERAAADVTVCCSRWVAEHGVGVRPSGCARQPEGWTPTGVLYQAVPKAPRPSSGMTVAGLSEAGCKGETRELRERLVIGRICSPQRKKWPAEIAECYAGLARRFAEAEWEFVGCSAEIRPRLQEACRGRATFYPASWGARSHLWRWDALVYHNPHVTESFGRVCAEAMRAGCAPVVDARGGFVEQVAPGTGFLCAKGGEYEEAIECLRAAGERRRMSRAAMAHADRVFSLERFGKDLRQLLGEAATPLWR